MQRLTNSIKIRTRDIAVLFVLLCMLMSAGTPNANANARPNNLDAELLKSIVLNDFSLFEILISKGANPNIIFGGEMTDWAMCAAATSSNIGFLKTLIAIGGNFDLRNPEARSWQSSPLHCAISSFNEHNVFLLIDEGANPNIRNCPECNGNWQSPFFNAAGRNRYSWVYMMLEAHEILPELTPPLIHSIENGRIKATSKEFQWRSKVVIKLQSSGYEVDGTYKDICEVVDCKNKK